MLGLQWLVFSDLRLLYVALIIFVLVVLIAIVRRPGVGIGPGGLIGFGALLLALGSGNPMWNRPHAGVVAVMVDLSPSTRGATFRDRAALDLRIGQLLGNLPHQTFAFSDHNQILHEGDALADLPAEQTSFIPPLADAILLFSDGQFSLPDYAPPTYPVVDPVLNHPTDAAIQQLNSVGHAFTAIVKNTNPPRPLAWLGATADPQQPQMATPLAGHDVTATLSPGDRWPENDSLSMKVAPPELGEKWWVGDSSALGWRRLSAAALPTDPADYLQPLVIVLNNVSAEALSSLQQQLLFQYVHDLGGALLIVGGNHAFAAGGYDGSLLEKLSPLSSSPPLPAQRWLVLIDGSGSMAGDPWQTEIVAVSHLLSLLPPQDAITFGSFAGNLSLWPTPNVPGNLFPTGPTNLAAALQQIIRASDGALPTQLLLMTDADTQLTDPGVLSAALSQKKIHLHLLAIGEGSALADLKSITVETGGSMLTQYDSRQWITSVEQLLRTALPDHYHRTTVPVTPAPPAFVAEWNQTWLKPAAIAVQQSNAVTMCARWQLGLGRVMAVAYPADAKQMTLAAEQIAAHPHDARFTITWDPGPLLHVKVDAVDGTQYLNELAIDVELEGIKTPVPQTAPGEYELNLPAPRTSQIVTVHDQDRVLQRFAVAGRYAPEFDAIGNNRENLNKLADRTGGVVVPPGPVRPIQFKWPTRQISLSSECAFAGFIAIAAGMLWNKKSLRPDNRLPRAPH